MSDLYQLIKKKLSTWFEKIPPPFWGGHGRQCSGLPEGTVHASAISLP